MVNEKLGVLIGRFQLGPHNSHLELIAKAASKVDRLIILVGSANQRVSPKNPFSADIRKDIIVRSCWEKNIYNVSFEPINDYPYSDGYWAQCVRETVAHRAGGATDITLFGFHKDETSFYLDMFPDWKKEELVSTDPDLSSTALRKLWFKREQKIGTLLGEAVPHAVLVALKQHEFDADLQSEYEYYEQERSKMFSGYPYPETLNFNCGDVVLECAGHILLGKRKNAPGRNCWAIFGGFKNNNETYLECALRELREECKIKVSERVLRKSIVATQIFDRPSRSQGIARITMAVHIKIDAEPDGSLPKVAGHDDIAEVQWVPLNDVLNNRVLFDDHKDIISFFTGVYQRPAYI